MKIGRSYLIPDETGKELAGELTHAVVMESWKAIIGCFHVKYPSRTIMARVPITDDEIRDYKRHPDVFFGVYKEHGKKINSQYETFKWLLGIYSQSSKEQLLSLMKSASDFEVLLILPQEELALLYSERMAIAMYNQVKKEI